MKRNSHWIPAALATVIVNSLAHSQSTQRVNVANDGSQADAYSGGGSISADGRFVAFHSNASNLAPDANGITDVFVRDLQFHTTQHMTEGVGGGQAVSGGYGGSISQDGGSVAFWSESRLVASDNNGLPDVYVRYRVGGVNERVSVDSGGAEGNGASSEPAISADGRFVAFSSRATNLVAGDTNAYQDVFVHDRQSGTTERVSVATGGAQGSNASFEPSISADGRFVAFSSQASNLVAGDTNGLCDVFVHDRLSGTTERLSVAASGAEANGYSYGGSISGDGRFVAFTSTAANLVPGDTNGVDDVFVRDRLSATTELVSAASWGGSADNRSGEVAISADGRFVAFHSSATNLVYGDQNNRVDAFLRDRHSATTEIVSLRTDGSQANNHSYLSSISPDGRFVTFDSLATNLVAGDTNGVNDVFVRDRGSPSAPFCFGDGSGAACPCGSGNVGDFGCPNSVHSGGAQLRKHGLSSLGADTLVLRGRLMPNSTALYLQGTLQLAGGAGVVFGDGLRCIGGTIVRLGTKQNLGGASQYPEAGDLSVSVRGQVTMPGARTYQIWYRNAANFCTTATFNLTNGLEVTWTL